MTILTYHSLDTSGSVVSVAPSDFAAQMAGMADLGYRGISLRQAVAHRDSAGTWPARSVVLSFDDGYANFHECALPVLRQYGFTATVFVVTGHLGGTNDFAPPPHPLGSLPMLSWEQTAELAAYDIEIGAHTQTHPDLSRLSAADVVREISASASDIEAHIGQPVESFAYPFGIVSGLSLTAASRQFRVACTTTLKRATTEALHLLPRVDAYYLPRAAGGLARVLGGRLDWYLALRRGGRSLSAALHRGLR